ncbi:uncharacterized protein LOC112604779 [Theropithecus gelada]|uniref:uncharacterized protein LOC112604779 n=1 Tax=Theropithecus gelada TaxID=9565 RepID=UPI000DC1754A|nr:uncharacterized protein LOC112604779 [Theropithecus gelada]
MSAAKTTARWTRSRRLQPRGRRPPGQAQVVDEPRLQREREELISQSQVEQVEKQGLAQAPAAADEHCQGSHIGWQPQAQRQGIGRGHHDETSRVIPEAAAANTQVPNTAVHL